MLLLQEQAITKIILNVTVTNLYLFSPYTILAKVDTGSDVLVKIVGGMVCIMMYEKAIYKRFGFVNFRKIHFSIPVL